MAAKGVKHGFVKKHVKHAMYKRTLLERKCTFGDFINFRSRAHKIETVNFYKVCHSAYDNKRHVLCDVSKH